MATFVLAIPDALLVDARTVAQGVTYGDVVTRFAGSALARMGAHGDTPVPQGQDAEAMAYWLSLGSTLGLISYEQQRGLPPRNRLPPRGKAKRLHKNNVVALSDFRAVR